MNDFIFQNTTRVYFGRDQLKNLGLEIKKYSDKVLIAYGGGSIKRSGLYDRILAVLKEAGIQVFELPGVEPNPRHTTVNKGAALCRERNIGALLAVGGGSTIDCCKAIAATALADTDDIWDLVTGKVKYDKALPVIAMPTIASTGSEMDKSCVIANTDLGVKSGINGEALRPAAAFLDPTNTFTVSKFQTACGGFDIFCHLLDCNYFVNAEKYPLQFGVVESLLRTVAEQLPIAVRTPDDYKARATLLWAASWALNSFCTSGFKTAVSNHAMEQFSAVYDTTHGLALSILAPRWMTYLLEKDPTTAADFARFGHNVFDCPDTGDSAADARAAITALEAFIVEELDLPHTLTALSIDDSRFTELAQKATKGGIIKGYRDLDTEDVMAIYRLCL